VNEGGMIHDIEFLRGEDKFIMLAGVEGAGAIQIRDTETGELFSSFPMPNLAQYNQIEITPDSNRCIITTGGTRTIGPTIELRSLGDYSIISKDSLPIVDEPKDTQGNFYKYVFHEMIVDPIRPLVYIWIEKTTFSGKKDRFYLKVYNYETMQLVKDLTPSDYNDEWPSKELFQKDDNYCFDVSDDGRYLAILKEGKTYLKIWNLETQELIKNKPLFDSQLSVPKDYWCEVLDIEFSSIDNDLIYISGKFPRQNRTENPNGVYKYYISSETFNLNELYSVGRILLFENESKILSYFGNELYFLNLLEQRRELSVVPTLQYPLDKKTITSKTEGLFIGYSGQFIGSIRYDSQTDIEDNDVEEIIISPNPTNSFVNITLECQESIIAYQIHDVNGVNLIQSKVENQSDILQIDFTLYPVGIYFLTINCDNPKTYKIVKED